jgi:hypothetical protein
MDFFDSDLVSKSCFFPSKNDEPFEGLFKVICDDSVTLHCYYYAGKSSKKKMTVVHFHGNGETGNGIFLDIGVISL